MLNIFSKKKEVVKEVVQEAPVKPAKQRSSVVTAEVIKEIHNAFDVAGDEALATSDKILDENQVSAEDREEAKLLEKLGFKRVAKLSEVNRELATINIATRRAEIVRKFKIKYPQYKFIFEDQVTAICKKYGLVCGEVWRYKGTVPRKNLLEIANFKVNLEDQYVEELNWQFDSLRRLNKSTEKVQDYRIHRKDVPFYICAPTSEMEMTSRTVKDGVFLKEREVPDPIVMHWMPEGFLIASKWGLEGQDPKLLNETMN